MHADLVVHVVNRYQGSAITITPISAQGNTDDNLNVPVTIFKEGNFVIKLFSYRHQYQYCTSIRRHIVMSCFRRQV